MLLANELELITLLNKKTKELGPTAQDMFAIFENPHLLNNGECPQFLPHRCLHKTFDLELIKSVLTNYCTSSPSARCVSLFCFTHPRPVCQQSSSNPSLVHSIPRPYSYYHPTPPLYFSKQMLHFPACPQQHLYCFPLTQAILLWARDRCWSHPHTAHQTHQWWDWQLGPAAWVLTMEIMHR